MIARRCLCCLLTALVLLAGVACSGPDSDPSAPTRAEIARLLAGHGAAVRNHDRAAFLAVLDASSRTSAFRRAQEAAFDNLARLPLSSFAYTIGPSVEAADAQAAARRRYGASALIVRLSVGYALRGVDPVPSRHDLWWTFARRDGKVVIASASDAEDVGGTSWQGPWDFGPISVVRAASSLVIGHPDNAGVLRTVSATVDAAVPAVTAVWGSAWSQHVAALVPSTPDELAAALGPISTVSTEVAAVATSDGADAVTGAVTGQRLVVEAAPLARLSDVGRRIVVQHEITHIATARVTGAGTPRWLVEGFADYVGNLKSGQSVGVAASELRTDVRHGRVPVTLPADADFDSPGTAAQAYESSWLACRLIARDAGPNGLVRFYRSVGTSHGDSDTAVATALRTVLHESPAEFFARWRAYLRGQLR